MGSIDNDAGLDKDGDVSDLVLAVTVGGPEEHVTRLSLGTGEMLAHG